MKSRTLACACLLLALVLAACQGSDALLGAMHTASAVDARGAAAPAATAFEPGDTVYASVELTQAYQDLRVTATWKRGDTALRTDELHAPRAVDRTDPWFAVFKLETGVDWPAGSYRCEVFVPDQGTQVLEFTLR